MTPSLFIILAMTLYAISYWTENLWFLVFLIFVALAAAIEKLIPKKTLTVFWHGALTGICFLLVGLPPLLIIEQVHYGDTNKLFITFIFKILLFFAVASLVYGGIIGTIFIAFQKLRKKMPLFPAYLICLPLLWVLAEIVLRKITFGFDWWLMGIPLISSSLFRPLVILGGVPALSFFAAAASTSLWLLIPSLKERRIWPIVFSLLLPLAGISYGFTYTALNNEENGMGLPSTAIVQPNIEFPKIFPIEKDAAYGPLIHRALELKAGIIILPAQIKSPLTKEEEINGQFWKNILGDALAKSSATIILYLPIKYPDEKIHQTMFALKQGKVAGEYKKEGLFPVSDYLPRGFYRILFSDPPGYAIDPYLPIGPEDKNGLIEKSWLIGGVICNEPFSPNIRERMKRIGAKTLIVSGSDRPFLLRLIFMGTLRMARLRAFESRIWIFRAYKSGISAVITPAGEIMQKLNKDERGIIYFDSQKSFTEKF